MAKSHVSSHFCSTKLFCSVCASHGKWQGMGVRQNARTMAEGNTLGHVHSQRCCRNRGSGGVRHDEIMLGLLHSHKQVGHSTRSRPSVAQIWQCLMYEPELLNVHSQTQVPDVKGQSERQRWDESILEGDDMDKWELWKGCTRDHARPWGQTRTEKSASTRGWTR